MSPIVFLDPGMSNSTTNIAFVKVDGTLSENNNPKPQLTEDEELNVILIPMNSLLSKLNSLQKEGYQIDGRLYAFALGLDFHNLSSHNQSQ